MVYILLNAVHCLLKLVIVIVSALVVITQKYLTTFSSGSLTNARYLFPIPEGASVCAFKMELTNGSVVSGVVKDTEKAKKVFQDAVSQGEWAGLAYEITADVFAISVGAIPAGQDVTVKITYATTVPDDESILLNQIRFAIPTFIGKKRYGTAPPELSQGRSSDDSATLSFNATVQLTSKIIGITSPSHEIDVEPSTRIQSRPAPLYSTTVKLRKPAPFDRDLVISIQAEKLDAPRCVAEVDEKARTVALSLTTVPRFGAPTVESQEYVFLIDRSGSMRDEYRMDYAKDALHHLIKNLPTSNTLFNIVSFGSKHSSLWGASIAYERRAVQEAEVYIDGMRSDMGGTEISSALGWIFRNRQQNTPMSVIVLTDGEVWEPEQVIALVGSEVKGASPDSPLRVFTLGIGSGASTVLCEGIARVGKGVCYMTTTNEEIKERSNKLLQAARTLSHGSASGITIDWGYHSPPSVVKADAEPKFVLPPLPAVLQAPPCIPNLYPGNRFIVSAILTDTVEIPQVVKLSGVLPDGSAVHLPPFKVAYTIANPDERPPLLHTLAAHRIIRTLEDGDIGAFGLNDGGSNDMHDEIVQTAVVEYGTKYSLATRFTSFVAVRDRAKRLQPHSERTLPASESLTLDSPAYN
ncbi:uncharacterized protein TRAVEDRAFT_117138 [Trametes versicolor FP-101664 SS1]|uniref:uncharacterized protein n=1 Tax=Trametes versicolor (strain FP-101664) TaxID=717944 RepID=UPI00046246C5|nr:uncharacterized protein TRAVEDRAFT_117138 [Trametes versicolor FP-101664 SS1]EIW62130.1 hypothetical protein TRAVEDRAFT_117138 [Trametes versicolor FP-101664 SS1]